MRSTGVRFIRNLHTADEVVRNRKASEVLETVQQPVGVGRIAARLELPEPHEPHHAGVDRLFEQMLEVAPQPGGTRSAILDELPDQVLVRDRACGRFLVGLRVLVSQGAQQLGGRGDVLACPGPGARPPRGSPRIQSVSK